MLYHRDLGFPSTLVVEEAYTFYPRYSAHAEKESKSDRYGEIKLPKRIDFLSSDIVEIETSDDKTIDKMVVRLSYNGTLDLCSVIIPETSVVKTVWINAKKDKHPTLDKSKYSN